MTLRIFYAFKGSVYQLNTYEFIAIMSCALIMIGATTTEQTCWIMIVSGNHPIIPVQNIITYLWTWVYFDILTRLILVYFFTRKFFGIFMLKQTHPSSQVEETQMSN
eukprot:474325_1